MAPKFQRNVVINVKSVILHGFLPVLLLAAAATPATDVGIDVFLDYPGYSQGERIDFYVSGFNREATPETVDIHMGVIAPDGTIYEYPDWNTTLTPWLPSHTLPPNLRFPATRIGNLDAFPATLEPGKVYRFAVALTRPGTLEILSSSSKPFKIVLDEGDTRQAYAIVIAHGSTPSENIPPVTASTGGFLRYSTDLHALGEKFRQMSPKIDQCLLHRLPSTLEELIGKENITYLDAGPTLVLRSTPTGEIHLDRQIDGKGSISYAPIPFNLPEEIYQSGKTYTISVPGSEEFSAFNLNVAAPGEIVVTQPEPTTFGTIDSRDDFILRWLGNDGVGEIGVTLTGHSTEPVQIVCRFADDGEGTIPSDLLTQLRNIVAAHPKSIDTPKIPGFDLPDIDPGITADFVIDRTNMQPVPGIDLDASGFTATWAQSWNVELQ